MLHSTTSIPGRAREVRPTTAAAAQESEKTADEDSHAASAALEAERRRPEMAVVTPRTHGLFVLQWQ